MVDLWYLNTQNISEEVVNKSLSSLPEKMVSEIIRLRNHQDRLLKLFGRLIVRKYHLDAGVEFNWTKWKLSTAGKPYYEGGKKISISHSGDYVIVVFSDREIGVDIERFASFDVNIALSYLHPLEAESILKAPNSMEAFFRIWTRKEAYLKAIGRGIIDGLNDQNCLQNKLTGKKTWYLHDIPLISDYKISLCTQIPDCQIKIRALLPSEFKI